MYNILVSDIWQVSIDNRDLFKLASTGGTVLMIGRDYISLMNVRIDGSSDIVFSIVIDFEIIHTLSYKVQRR